MLTFYITLLIQIVKRDFSAFNNISSQTCWNIYGNAEKARVTM